MRIEQAALTTFPGRKAVTPGQPNHMSTSHQRAQPGKAPVGRFRSRATDLQVYDISNPLQSFFQRRSYRFKTTPREPQKNRKDHDLQVGTSAHVGGKNCRCIGGSSQSVSVVIWC